MNARVIIPREIAQTEKPQQRVAALPAAPRVGLVHDWLTGYRGGERVLEAMIRQYPKANLYTAIDFVPEEERAFLQGAQPITTFAQRVPLMRKHYRAFLPLLMFAIEQLDLSDRELILSTSAAIARGVLTGPGQLHIAYIHSPMRYAWDLQHQYLNDAGLRGMRGLLARWLLHKARFWDMRTANGVDHFIANSQFIARRIWKVYRRKAKVIYPPVNVEQFALRESKDSFYLTASSMVPYKKIPAIVEAFASLPEKQLVVVGDGSEMARVKAVAGRNVQVLGYQSSNMLRDLMQRARAFVFAAEEDFGIAPVEAQACGTPVIAYGRGGALETIRGADRVSPTGLFFADQRPQTIAEAVRAFERIEQNIDPRACRENALRFSERVFEQRYRGYVQRKWDQFKAGSTPGQGKNCKREPMRAPKSVAP